MRFNQTQNATHVSRSIQIINKCNWVEGTTMWKWFRHRRVQQHNPTQFGKQRNFVHELAKTKKTRFENQRPLIKIENEPPHSTHIPSFIGAKCLDTRSPFSGLISRLERYDCNTLQADRKAEMEIMSIKAAILNTDCISSALIIFL